MSSKSFLLVMATLAGLKMEYFCIGFTTLSKSKTSVKTANRITTTGTGGGPPNSLLYSKSVEEDDQYRRKVSRKSLTKLQKQQHDWGIERWKEPVPRFPFTVAQVADSAFIAIASALYGLERLDPNTVSNAMSDSVLDYRPTRKSHDRGRIGIEIDGSRHLFPRFINRISEQSATREVSLNIASRLAKGPWKGVENMEDSFVRPVTIYFNTVKQSLVASRELSMLKRRNPLDNGYENIIIESLGADSIIPKCLLRQRKSTESLPKGYVNPLKGLIIIVQPSDFNDEYRPPGPAVDSVSHLQRLCAMATVHNIPVVTVSPRFLVQQPDSFHNWDQSGFQQASVYGGMEPPKGPTPWLMRDFTPPVFVWAGAAHVLDEGGARISLFQSVMNPYHSWHSFLSPAKDSDSYEYLATTKASSGRPTVSIMQKILDDWKGGGELND